MSKSFLRSWRLLIIFLADSFVIGATGILALLVRFDFSFSAIPSAYLGTWLWCCLIQIVVTFGVFLIRRMYHYIWRTVNVWDVFSMIVSVFLAFAPAFLLCAFFDLHLPKSIWFIMLVLQICGLVGERCAFRFLLVFRSYLSTLRHNDQRIMLIGAGAAGRVLAREISSSEHIKGRLCCVIDDSPAKIGKYMDGVQIVGGRDCIVEAAKKYEITQIIFAIPTATHQEKADILNICKLTGCRLRVLPGLYQLVNGEVSLAAVQDVQVEDLLGRKPVQLDTQSVSQFLEKKVVLVTGGGGSIGSELCRQIMRYRPRQLLIFDIYENCAYELEMELHNKYGADINVVTLIGSIRDIKRLDEVFETYHPSVVFHAAAHKHVPLMEVSPAEAVKNNVFGTKNLLTSAAEHGVERFVQLSTDKAVNPTNVMGCTKRICEMLIQTFAKNTSMKCMAVRFGNVLGSHGSVIPLFEEQIKNGGPVTITHPDIVRYFMTIPEAAQLVLQAGGLAQSGSIYVLDMGEPVKIMDLATRLIRFYGYEPNVNMEIKVTGLRPGEKLYEELMLDSEQDRMTKTAHDKIFIAPPMQIDLAAFYEELQNLRHDAEHNDEGVVLSLQRMVGTYHPNRVVNEDHTVSAAHGNTETIDKEELQKALDEQHSTQQNAQ